MLNGLLDLLWLELFVKPKLIFFTNLNSSFEKFYQTECNYLPRPWEFTDSITEPTSVDVEITRGINVKITFVQNIYWDIEWISHYFCIAIYLITLCENLRAIIRTKGKR